MRSIAQDFCKPVKVDERLYIWSLQKRPICLAERGIQFDLRLCSTQRLGVKSDPQHRNTVTPKPMNSTQHSALSSQASLRGWVNSFYRHYKGKRLGPYYVRRWKVGRKLHREYIKPQDVERIKAECAAHRERQQTKSEGARRTNNFVSNFAFMAKMLLLWERGKDSTPAQYAYLQRIDQEGMFITGWPGTADESHAVS
jgi:hypothetical protein